MYAAFTEQQVFQNPDINVYCNLLYEEIIKYADLPTIQANFAMIDTLALMIDGAPLVELSVITYGVKLDDIFNKIQKNLGESLGTVTVNFPDRVQMIWNDVFFEIWHKPLMNIKTVNTLQIEDLTV